MVQPDQTQAAAGKRTRTRVRAEHRYPVYDLESSIEVARRIRERAGGTASADQIASFFDYSSTRSGAFLTRVSSAAMFGLIVSERGAYTVTALAQTIIAPELPGTSDAAARYAAFMSVPLYGLLVERYRGQQLPPEVGLRNTMETAFGMPRSRTQVAYRVFMDSAAQAGFFDARGGQRTHLVQPVIAEPSINPGDQPMQDDDGEIEPPDNPEPAGVPESPRARTSVTERLQEALVEKIKEIPAEDIEKIREYIREIERLDEARDGERQENT